MSILPQVFGLLIVGIVTLIVTYGAAGSSIPRNHVIGIRLKWSLESDEAWKVTHVVFKPYAIACAVIAIAHSVAIVIVNLATDSDLWTALLTLSGYLCVFAVLLIGLIPAKKAVKEIEHN